MILFVGTTQIEVGRESPGASALGSTKALNTENQSSKGVFSLFFFVLLNSTQDIVPAMPDHYGHKVSGVEYVQVLK